MSFDENTTAPILARLRDAPAGPLDQSDEANATLSRYATVLYMRSPHQRARSQANARDLALRKAIEFGDSARFARMIARAGIQADPLEIEVLRLRYVLQLREGTMQVDPWPIAVGVALRRAGFIAAMRKFVIRCNSSSSIVCSDAAVVLMRDLAYYEAGGLGLGSPGGRGGIPL